ncbi:MAG: HesA/MoeB/ThiF family protein [Spirochaetaceae bacterium]
MSRFIRQIELIGVQNQEKLKESKVLVIGSGGLGSPVLQSLAVSGIGTIGIVDYDTIDITNLNRQILHDEDSIGDYKTISAEKRLNKMNQTIDIMTYKQTLTEESAKIIFPNFDIIIDCVDNYETRKLVSKEAVKLNKTVIEGGIEGFDGFIQIIEPSNTACFNCLELNNTDIYRQVLGASTGIVGNIQALECIKYIIGLWDRSYSYISVNLINYDIDTILLKSSTNCNCYNKKGENIDII